ncbi:MAG: acetyl-CoA carboxylase biotin carboxyl carrier protein subunit [Ignavibacteriae bacterium]|nr:acetyl-CoA carboxylase biotin carboxyl carrier protein subunit [Ignavibacteriota bacterium]
MQLKFKDKEYELKLEKQNDNQAIIINNEKIDFSSILIDTNIFSVFSDGSKTNVYAAEDDNRFYVNIDGNNFTFDKVKAEEKSFGEEEKDLSNKQIIKPPMPGSIVKVLVEKGQKVEEGEGLIIIEAMKMETTMYSSISGIVTEVNATAGEQVDSDKVLLVVEKEKEE